MPGVHVTRFCEEIGLAELGELRRRSSQVCVGLEVRVEAEVGCLQVTRIRQNSFAFVIKPVGVASIR